MSSDRLFLWTLERNTCRCKGVQSHLWDRLSCIPERFDHLGCNGSEVHRTLVDYNSCTRIPTHESVRVHAWFAVRPWANVKPGVRFTKAVPRPCEWVPLSELFRILLASDGSTQCGRSLHRNGGTGQTELLKELHGLVDFARVFDACKQNGSILEKLVRPLRVFDSKNHSRNRLDFWIIAHSMFHRQFPKLFFESGQIERLVDVENTIHLAILGFCSNQVFRAPPVLCNGEVCRLGVSRSENRDGTFCDHDRLCSPFRHDAGHARRIPDPFPVGVTGRRLLTSTLEPRHLCKPTWRSREYRTHVNWKFNNRNCRYDGRF